MACNIFDSRWMLVGKCWGGKERASRVEGSPYTTNRGRSSDAALVLGATCRPRDVGGKSSEQSSEASSTLVLRGRAASGMIAGRGVDGHDHSSKQWVRRPRSRTRQAAHWHCTRVAGSGMIAGRVRDGHDYSSKQMGHAVTGPSAAVEAQDRVAMGESSLWLPPSFSSSRQASLEALPAIRHVEPQRGMGEQRGQDGRDAGQHRWRATSAGLGGLIKALMVKSTRHTRRLVALVGTLEFPSTRALWLHRSLLHRPTYPPKLASAPPARSSGQAA